MLRVAIFEDDHPNARVVEVVLRRQGFATTVLGSADELLRLARDGLVDLVVMDAELRSARVDDGPISGEDLAGRLKDDPRTSDIIVLLAADPTLQREAQASSSRADAYVAKPFHLDDFLGVVRGLVEKFQREAAPASSGAALGA